MRYSTKIQTFRELNINTATVFRLRCAVRNISFSQVFWPVHDGVIQVSETLFSRGLTISLRLPWSLNTAKGMEPAIIMTVTLRSRDLV